MSCKKATRSSVGAEPADEARWRGQWHFDARSKADLRVDLRCKLENQRVSPLEQLPFGFVQMPSSVQLELGTLTVGGLQVALQVAPTRVLLPQLNVAFVTGAMGLPVQAAGNCNSVMRREMEDVLSARLASPLMPCSIDSSMKPHQDCMRLPSTFPMGMV